MSDDNVTDLPTNEAVDFDLDTYVDPDAKKRPEPFRAKVNGKVLSFGDPQDIDWQDIAYANSPVEIIQFALSDDDLDHLRRTPMASKKFGALAEAWGEHFGLKEVVKEVQREQRRNNANIRGV